MKIDRKFTVKGASPYKTITFKKVRSEIKNPDGSVIFKLNDVTGCNRYHRAKIL